MIRVDYQQLATELDQLIAKATDDDLSDGGRYFAESRCDLTQCSHSETGEYDNRADGRLIEWLWNNRRTLRSALTDLASECGQ